MEVLTLGAIAATILDVFEDYLGRDAEDYIDDELEKKIIEELKPLIKPTDYGYDTDEIKL